MARIEVFKTYKLFIGGQFPRSESGRYYTVKNAKGQALANISLSSRKDFRNAVSAARSAQPSWAGRAAFNRGQILYRIAEMMEGRADQFVHELEEMGFLRRLPMRKHPWPLTALYITQAGAINTSPSSVL